MNIGVAGTGRMGAAIAQRLLSLGHKVSVWNRTPAKAAPLAAKGAIVASSLADLARDSEVVITILTDAAAIGEVYEGSAGLLAGDVRGKTFIEMSTVRPETERVLNTKILAKGAALVECPVGGTVAPALDGKLLGLAGGAPDDVARMRPLLESRDLDRLPRHVGGARCAQPLVEGRGVGVLGHHLYQVERDGQDRALRALRTGGGGDGRGQRENRETECGDCCGTA